MQMRWAGRAGARAAGVEVGGPHADERPRSGRRPGGTEATALSLTGADPPDAAGSSARAGASGRAVDAPCEAAGQPLPEAAEPWATTRGGLRIPKQVCAACRGSPRPLAARSPSPTAPGRAALPAGAGGREGEVPRRESRLWNARRGWQAHLCSRRDRGAPQAHLAAGRAEGGRGRGAGGAPCGRVGPCRARVTHFPDPSGRCERSAGLLLTLRRGAGG